MSDASFHDTDDELLSAYVDGELTDAERAAVEQRLRDDPRAQALVAELRAVSETLQALPKFELGTSLREAVLRQSPIRAERAHAEGGGTRRWAWAVLAVAAALMLTVYLPEANRDEQPLAQAPQKKLEARQNEPQLIVANEKATPELSLRAKSPAAPLSETIGGTVENIVELKPETDNIASADSFVTGTAIDGTLRGAPIQTPQIQPIGELPAEDYLVHLTPVDRSVGTTEFDQLLASHGIALRGDSSNSSNRGAGERRTDLFAVDKEAEETKADKPTEGELVIVEAPLEQIQQLVASCSGANSPWKSLRLVGQDGADARLLETKADDSPAEAGIAVAMESLSLSDDEGQESHGWALHLGRNRVALGLLPEVEAVQRELAGNERQSAGEPSDNKQQPKATIRVLFILHPAEH